MEENIYEPVLNRLWERETEAIGVVKEAENMIRDMKTLPVKKLNEMAKDFRERKENVFELMNTIGTHLSNLSDPTRRRVKEAEALVVIEELSCLSQKVQTYVLAPMLKLCEAVQNRQMEVLMEFEQNNAQLALEVEEAEELLKKEREKNYRALKGVRN
ncbi:hypothetical protein IKF74_00240 [Candidatus Saccharibacteria bacterium]|nr:hypothetical protein [Candidatus Saccharibacteria bacterium]